MTLDWTRAAEHRVLVAGCSGSPSQRDPRSRHEPSVLPKSCLDLPSPSTREPRFFDCGDAGRWRRPTTAPSRCDLSHTMFRGLPSWTFSLLR
ncbi:uncharacterized protein B0H18DRAFT_149120 [Fomitopsis serialis]|uniref:uncharacterized protein n=1 Tax=Fomitopsis serialis TaxID=139415 RepID=UPI002007D531|nr:uncharacterized protein B0H18DRAFT_149120 [Neoantrodia serialis]KAH9930373.1 hypothetical protein B0H18DRAFT_149120 [Neoantrodia serialis]